VHCTKCGSDNPTTRSFCGDCGAALLGEARVAAGSEMPVFIAAGSDDIAWLRKVYELGNAFAKRLDLDELIAFVLARCRELLNAEDVAVLFFDPERNELYFLGRPERSGSGRSGPKPGKLRAQPAPQRSDHRSILVHTHKSWCNYALDFCKRKAQWFQRFIFLA
jgi:hypothetical protein